MELSGLWLAIRFLAYPGFNEEFKIHTDASNFQLGAVITQKGKPIAVYSIQIIDYQKEKK